MLEELLKDWKGSIDIGDKHYTSADACIFDSESISSDTHIILHSASKNATQTKIEASSDITEYRITVKKYMTEKSSPGFDFMAKWNKDNPMPLRTMTGTIEKETRGMVYMKLRGDIWTEKIDRCMKCGRILTNPVSQYFGIGPECGGHNYVHPFSTDAELKAAVSAYKKQIQNIQWEGWIIKSAITEKEEV